MKEFKTQICTTKEQSQRLLDLGLKPETADMEILVIGGEEIAQFVGFNITADGVRINNVEIEGETISYIPAWSLHRLMEIGNIENVGFADIKNIYDTCINMIASHIKLGLLNKEYLKS